MNLRLPTLVSRVRDCGADEEVKRKMSARKEKGSEYDYKNEIHRTHVTMRAADIKSSLMEPLPS